MLFIDVEKRIVFGTCIAKDVIELGLISASLQNQKV
jgi:hypothetical protein